jgi:hypothetical protein
MKPYGSPYKTPSSYRHDTLDPFGFPLSQSTAAIALRRERTGEREEKKKRERRGKRRRRSRARKQD